MIKVHDFKKPDIKQKPDHLVKETIMTKEKCMDMLRLTEDEIEIINNIDKSLQYIAELVDSDIFIDCFDREKEICYVVSEAKPSSGNSLYSNSVIGEVATQKKEPAVFIAYKTGIPARNIRAVTQENRMVRQDVIPIENSSKVVFAVLIREKDISANIQSEKKYQELAHMSEELNEMLMRRNGDVTPYMPSINDNIIAMKEIHHRIKNNLQFVASILNIQSRKIDNIEAKQMFEDNVNRILSIALVHDILTQDGLSDKISLNTIINAIMGYMDTVEKNIKVKIEGENILINPNIATSIAVIINELLGNAYKHAFKGRDSGEITISIFPDILYSSIVVSDNGVGFDVNKHNKKSLGLELVKLTVMDKLKGKLQISSSERGSTIKFDFKN